VGLCLVGATGLGAPAASASPSLSTVIVCPAKVRGLVRPLVAFETAISTSNWTWKSLPNKITVLTLLENHISAVGIAKPCLRKVLIPAGHAVVEYTRGVSIAVDKCEISACDENHKQQINPRLDTWQSGD
jgi:hypothetical protein